MASSSNEYDPNKRRYLDKFWSTFHRDPENKVGNGRNCPCCPDRVVKWMNKDKWACVTEPGYIFGSLPSEEKTHPWSDLRPEPPTNDFGPISL